MSFIGGGLAFKHQLKGGLNWCFFSPVLKWWFKNPRGHVFWQTLGKGMKLLKGAGVRPPTKRLKISNHLYFDGDFAKMIGTVIYFTRDCVDGWTSLITITINKNKDHFEKKTHLLLWTERPFFLFCCVIVTRIKAHHTTQSLVISVASGVSISWHCFIRSSFRGHYLHHHCQRSLLFSTAAW